MIMILCMILFLFCTSEIAKQMLLPILHVFVLLLLLFLIWWFILFKSGGCFILRLNSLFDPIFQIHNEYVYMCDRVCFSVYVCYCLKARFLFQLWFTISRIFSKNSMNEALILTSDIQRHLFAREAKQCGK